MLYLTEDGLSTDASSIARIQYSTTNNTSLETTYYDAVYCTDLYADEIAAERNQSSSTKDFTKAFKDEYGQKWVCPNATKVVIDSVTAFKTHILPCANAQQALYAEDMPCEEPEDGQYYSASIKTRMVSTHFNAEIYHTEKKRQLYSSTMTHPY